MNIPSMGLAAGFVLFLVTSVPTLWHKSEQKTYVGFLRAICWAVAMGLVVMGLLPILGLI